MASLPHKPLLALDDTLILVTGASGHIASHVIAVALRLGYKVRGTARSQAKADQTTKLHRSDRYSTAIVEDFAKSHAQVAAALKGVDSVIHLATSTEFTDKPDVVIPAAVEGVTTILSAAANEPSVKRFVLTSSCAALFFRVPGESRDVDTSTWNDEAVAWARDRALFEKDGQKIVPAYFPFTVYSASKVEQERALWKFIEDKKPHFAASAILPDYVAGKILDEGSTGPSALLVRNLYEKGERIGILNWFINVEDNAELHVIAAVLDDSVDGKRLIAAAGGWNSNAMIDIIKKYQPGWDKAEKDPADPWDESNVDNRHGSELLKKWFGHGYTTLEQTVVQNLPQLVQ